MAMDHTSDDLMLRSSGKESSHSNNTNTGYYDTGGWTEIKHRHDAPDMVSAAAASAISMGDHVDGPTYAQAPVVYIDGVDPNESSKVDSAADLLALKSRRRRRPSSSSSPSSAPSPGVAMMTASSSSIPSSAAAALPPPTVAGDNNGVAFSSFEMSYVGAVPPYHHGDPNSHLPYHQQHQHHQHHQQQHHHQPPQQPHAFIPIENVSAFLQSLSLSFSGDLRTVVYLCSRLSEMGYDSIFALAFASDRDLAMAGISFEQDQRVIRDHARHEFSHRRPQGPPGLYQMVTMSKWLMQCSIPRHMATLYTTNLHRFGYDSVQHFEGIGHDSRALSVFHRGHYHLFKYHLERVLQHQYAQPTGPGATTTANGGYTTPAYYNSNNGNDTDTSDRAAAAAFQSTLLDDLVPPGVVGFPMSPIVQHSLRHQHHGQHQQGVNPGRSSDHHEMSLASSFTQMMHDDEPSSASASVSSVSSSIRTLNEMEQRLLFEAVHLDDKANPYRRGKKVDWNVLATNGMGDPKFAVLAQYTANELEQNYASSQQHNHDHGDRHPPLLANARSNSEWSQELVRLLWKVSQDTRCKNGTKTMWEQIARGRTGVPEYAPLGNFSNSQLRSRFRTEFGDKRPQSRKRAREVKNAAAKAALQVVAQETSTTSNSLALGGVDHTSKLKSAANKKTAAISAKARKQKQNDKRKDTFADALEDAERVGEWGAEHGVSPPQIV